MLLTANTNVNGKSKSYASKQTVTKIGESGLALKHLELSFKRGGFEGLRVLLSELNSKGKPRVTKSKMIIKNISAYFEKQNVDTKCEISLQEMGVVVKCCQSCNFLESHCLLVFSKCFCAGFERFRHHKRE